MKRDAKNGEQHEGNKKINPKQKESKVLILVWAKSCELLFISGRRFVLEGKKTLQGLMCSSVDVVDVNAEQLICGDAVINIKVAIFLSLTLLSVTCHLL